MTPNLQSDLEGLTSAALNGRYGVVRVGYGSHVETAGLGTLSFDGEGRVSGTLVSNVPAQTFGQRAQVRASIDGTFAINTKQTGFGLVEAAVASEAGGSVTLRAELLVIRAEDVGGVKTVQEFCLMEYEVDAVSGGLHLIHGARHPMDATFSAQSLEGVYAGPGIGLGGRVPAAAIGMGWARYDGNGGFMAVDIQNVPGAMFGARERVSYDTPEGRYEVYDDGTGMIIAPGGRANFVVTRVGVVDGAAVALAYFFVQHDLHPSTGNLVMTTITKRWG